MHLLHLQAVSYLGYKSEKENRNHLKTVVKKRNMLLCLYVFTYADPHKCELNKYKQQKNLFSPGVT